jgi:hypothetical protein
MVRSPALRTILAGAAAVLLLVTLPAEAQWKWKDKSGRVQYSDLPPPVGTPDQDILGRPTARRTAASPVVQAASAASAPLAAPGASGPLAPRAADPELEARRKKAESDQAAKAKANEEKIAALRAENCARAKAAVRTYDSGVRIGRINEKGEREFLDDKQRADEARRAKDAVAADCK